jgi:hypothetical protein
MIIVRIAVVAALILIPAAAKADAPAAVPIVTPVLQGTGKIVRAIAEPAANIVSYFVLRPAGMIIAPVARVPRDLIKKPRRVKHAKRQ